MFFFRHLHMIFMLFLSVSLAIPASAAQVDSGRVLVDPNDVDLFFLSYFMAKVEPSFPTLADLDSTVQRADEFNRVATKNRIIAQLQSRYNSIADVKFIKINLNSEISEYDTKYGEYDFLKLGDGTIIPSGYIFGKSVQIALTNGGEAQSWKLSPAEAEDVLHKNHGSRATVLAMKLKIEGAAPPVEGVPVTLNARVLEIDVMGDRQNVRLGKVVVPQ